MNHRIVSPLSHRAAEAQRQCRGGRHRSFATRRSAALATAALLLSLCLPAQEASAESVVLRAMRDELARSTEELKLAQMDKPYFLAYRIDDSTVLDAEARFGALTAALTNRSRLLSVEVRVGDASLDNTNFLPIQTWGSPLTRSFGLPLEDDYQEIRRQIWLATDLAYKHALETFAKKRAALQTNTREEVPDFTTEQPHTSHSEALAEQPSIDEVKPLVQGLAALFKEMPAIHESAVGARVVNVHSRYVNSEGTSFTQSQPTASLRVLAKTQAPDGTVLQDFELFYERSWQDLPGREALERSVRSMGASLAARREAEFVELYNGPVLFEGQAAAALFAQVIAPRLLAVRVPIADQRLRGYAASLRNPFVDKIGARVLPRSLDVRDDPTIDHNDAGPLLGGYAVDGDGVPAQETTLIERGVLRTLLAARNPSTGITTSTGNQRGEMLMPSNLLVSTERGLSSDAMREELMALVVERDAEFGIVVRRLGLPFAKIDGSDRPSSGRGEIAIERLTRAYKVYADGREEPIRKAELSGFGEASFRDIVAVSQAVSNHTLELFLTSAYALRQASARYGTTPGRTLVSLSIPDLLFEEASVRKPPGNVPRPPLAAHPFFE